MCHQDQDLDVVALLVIRLLQEENEHQGQRVMRRTRNPGICAGHSGRQETTEPGCTELPRME